MRLVLMLLRGGHVTGVRRGRVVGFVASEMSGGLSRDRGWGSEFRGHRVGCRVGEKGAGCRV